MNYFKHYTEFLNEAMNVSPLLEKVKTIEQFIDVCKGKILKLNSEKSWSQTLDARDKGRDQDLYLLEVGPEKCVCVDFPSYFTDDMEKTLLKGMPKLSGGSYSNDKDTAKVWEMFQYNRKRGQGIFLLDEIISTEKRDELQKYVDERAECFKKAMSLIYGEEHKGGYYSWDTSYDNEVTNQFKPKEGKKRKSLNVSPALVWMNTDIGRIHYPSKDKPDTFCVYTYDYMGGNNITPKFKEEQGRKNGWDAENFLTAERNQSFGSHYNDKWRVFKVPAKDLRAADAEIRKSLAAAEKVQGFIRDWMKYETRGTRLSAELGIGG